jgi:alkaline phosphatase
MTPVLDRARLAPEEPDLATMTRKAIDLLAAEKRGFLLMVEGSQMDWGAHDNDPGYAVSELLAFDDAVAAALEFARRDGQTLVLAFADHGTGGVSLGNARTDTTWSHTSADDVVAPIRGMRATAGAIADELGDEPDERAVAAAIRTWWGIDLDKGEAAEILALRDSGRALAEAIGRTVSLHHTVVGWTTFEHVGSDVPLWSFGPGRPAGLVANTDLAPTAAAFLRLDLGDAESSLFVAATDAFPDATLEHPEGDDPVLVAAPCRIPANRDLVACDGLAHPVAVDGVAFYVPSTERFYLSQAAVTVIQRVRDGLPVE